MASQPVVSQPVYQQPTVQPIQPAYQQPIIQVQPVVIPAAQEPAKKSNGAGIAGLIFGILTLVTCWIPFVPFFFGFFGLVLSIIGLILKNRGKGQAIAGLIMSVLGAIIGVAVLILFAGIGSYLEKASIAASSVDAHDASVQSIEDEINAQLGDILGGDMFDEDMYEDLFDEDFLGG
jgi:hypothetical protein